MFRITVRRVLPSALVLGACVSGLTSGISASAQSVGPSVPPTNINSAQPTVSGVLVAKPMFREGNIPAACRDRDQTSLNTAVMKNRGVVICTAEGRLVLLQLSSKTGIYALYWGKYELRRLSDGDHINAWGTLQDNGYVLNPSVAIQDTDIQFAYADSQDLITGRGPFRLALDVLKSDDKGPVQGAIHALRVGRFHITLCNGQPGRWSDLTRGKTVDISRSLFNRRTMTYIRLDSIRVVSCS